MRRRGPSAPVKALHRLGLLRGRMLDFGCGHGHDAEFMGAEGYDPHWRPEPAPTGEYDTVTCIFVLNVVGPETEAEVIESVRRLLAPGGRAYFAVRRDIPRDGRPGRGVLQRWVELDLPVVARGSGFVIYGMAFQSTGPR